MSSTRPLVAAFGFSIAPSLQMLKPPTLQTLFLPETKTPKKRKAPEDPKSVETRKAPRRTPARAASNTILTPVRGDAKRNIALEQSEDNVSTKTKASTTKETRVECIEPKTAQVPEDVSLGHKVPIRKRWKFVDDEVFAPIKRKKRSAVQKMDPPAPETLPAQNPQSGKQDIKAPNDRPMPETQSQYTHTGQLSKSDQPVVEEVKALPAPPKSKPRTNKNVKSSTSESVGDMAETVQPKKPRKRRVKVTMPRKRKPLSQRDSNVRFLIVFVKVTTVLTGF